MDKLLGTDKASPTGKNKINGIIDKLRGGYLGQVLVSLGNGVTDPQWSDIVPNIPGGTANQVLTKINATPNSYEFRDTYKPFVNNAEVANTTISTNNTFLGVASKSDSPRTNVITFGLQSYAVAETQFNVELLKNSVSIKTWQTSTNDTSTDLESYSDIKSISYVDQAAAASSTYQVKITKGSGSASIVISNFQIYLLGV